jgi:cell division protein FtsI (penicillin-binding protein 3)
VTGRAVRLRILLTSIALIAVLVGLTLRAAQLAVVQAPTLQDRAIRQHHQQVKLPPPRGAIVDRYGELLALTRDSGAVYMRPPRLNAEPGALAQVAGLLDLPLDAVMVKASSSAPFVYLHRQVSLDRLSAVEELQVPGIGSEPARMRYYPHGPLAGQVLGFIGIDGQGLEGVERQFDAELGGEVEALAVERDARGRRMVVDERWRPLPRVGAQVELTLDAALQHVAERELERAVEEFNADGGVVVALEPATGAVLAMANVPRMDSNQPGGVAHEFRRNRAITDFHEPGSTFKVFLAAAALERGVVRPEEKVFCENGVYPVGRRVIHDHHPYGLITFSQVIQQSSNIGCAKVAERLGVERYAQAIADFGFGQRTGIELPGESPGMVRPAAKWGRIHLVTTAFGQGIAATPLQMARAFAAIANGGLLVRPHIVRRIVGENGEARYVTRRQVVRRVMSEKTSRKLTDILRGAVENGTGKAARMEGFAVAGKTGTAQKVEAGGRYSKRARISSFIGYVPAEQPRLLIMVMLDTPRKATYGGIVAAPTFRRIAEYGLERLGTRPTRGGAVAPPEPSPPGNAPAATDAPLLVGVPSFLGLSMRDAVVQAQRFGWEVRIEGSGYVTAQDPPPGASLPSAELALKFGPPTL